MKRYNFKWNVKRVIATFLSVILGFIPIFAVVMLFGIGIIGNAIVLMPTIIDNLAIPLQDNPMGIGHIFVSVIPLSYVLIVLFGGTYLTMKFCMTLFNLTDKLWDKIPNSIKGEPLFARRP